MFRIKWRFRERRQQVELRVGARTAGSVHVNLKRLAKVFPSLFGKPGDEGNRTVDAHAFGGIDDLVSTLHIELLINDLLHLLRADFDPIKDSLATRTGHECKQFLIDAIGASTNRPGESCSGSDHCLAECHYALSVDGEHVVDQFKVVDRVSGGNGAHVGQDALWGPKAEPTAEEVI